MSVHDGSWGDLLSGKNLAGSIALAGGVALHAINIYIATTVLPSVVKDIGGLDLYAWNTTLFVVASILGSALTAKLLATAGSRGAYAIAAVLFMAEYEECEDGSFVLIENHCPICAAASTCQSFCRAELTVFREVLQAKVERTEHILHQARRCAYRVQPL